MSESILTSSSVPSGNTETAPPNDTFQTSTPNDTFQTSTPNNTFQTSTPNNTFQTSPTRSRTGSAANPLGLPINPGEYPSLGLSGRILSATICLPHTILYTHDESDPWVCFISYMRLFLRITDLDSLDTDASSWYIGAL